MSPNRELVESCSKPKPPNRSSSCQKIVHKKQSYSDTSSNIRGPVRFSYVEEIAKVEETVVVVVFLRSGVLLVVLLVHVSKLLVELLHEIVKIEVVVEVVATSVPLSERGTSSKLIVLLPLLRVRQHFVSCNTEQTVIFMHRLQARCEEFVDSPSAISLNFSSAPSSEFLSG